MSADATDKEAALDVRVPTRRRRASDDELDDAEFHDAAEYAASVAGSHAIGEDQVIADGDSGEDVIENDDESAGNEDAPGEVVEAEIPLGETDQIEERKKAKLREPFDVPTSGAFWLHDDRFGEDEQAERSRSAANERKPKSDTEGRWLHDKFSLLDVEDGDGNDGSESAFSHFRRGRGRGLRGGRRGGGRGSPPSGRGRGPILSRGRRGEGSGSMDNNAYDPADPGAPASPDEMQGALPQREQRPPRAGLTRNPAMSGAGPAPHTDEPGKASNGASPYMAEAGAARGRGRGSGRIGRGGAITGRGRGERSVSPDGGPRSCGLESEVGPGYGRGRGRGGWDEGPRAEGGVGREGYGSGSRGRRGEGGRGGYHDVDDRDAGPGARDVGASTNGGPYDGGRGRGRGRGRPPVGDSYTFGRGSGPSRGAGPGRGASAQSQLSPQEQRRHNRSAEEDFPPLPGSAARPPAAAPTTSPDAESPAWAAADVGATAAAGGVRRYSKMAGKVSVDAAGSTAAPLAEGGQRSRGDGGANRASKLSAAAPTFEPSPAASAGQAGKQPGAAPPPQQPSQAPAPMSSVPAAYGAPLQPMSTVPSMPLPAASPAVGVAEAYGAPPMQQRPAQPAPYMSQQPPPPPMQQPQPLPSQQPYNAPMQTMPAHQAQGMMVAGQLGPQQQPMQQPQPNPYGAAAGGQYSGYSDMETWFQDAYQKALATGMDPQQAYSTVQGYVQGMQMAFQQLRGAYPGMGPQMQAPPAGP